MARIKNAELSAPTGVTHTAHVGFNQDGTFDVSSLPPEWKALLAQAGVNDADLIKVSNAHVTDTSLTRH